MPKRDDINATAPVLDEDILQLLAEAQEEVELPAGPGSTYARQSPEVRWRRKTPVFCRASRLSAQLKANGLMLCRVRVSRLLHQEGDSGLLTYLARLDPGFEMSGHPHPFDEECIMLEGELWFGDLHLKAGDYHFAAKGVYHGRLRTETGALAFLKGALPA
ncbi:MAG: cupin domain-containing protein [Thiolinea sp.]